MKAGRLFILQALVFLLAMNFVSANSGVYGDIFYNIIIGVTDIKTQAPQVYTNQSFFVKATIKVDKSYNENTFNATIMLPSGFSLPDNDYNHTNPNITGTLEYSTNWTVRSKPSASNYTINISIPFFNSTRNALISMVSRPSSFDNGSIILNAGGPYNSSSGGRINITLRDNNSNYVNIIGSCNITIYYPNSSIFTEKREFEYETGSNGLYNLSFTAPNTTGNYSLRINCTLPSANRTGQFEVLAATGNRSPKFSNVFLLTGSYIQRSDNNPTPTQNVDFYVSASDPDNDTLNLTFFYSTNNLQSFSQKAMVYDAQTDTWRMQLGNYPAQTTAYYYVLASDGMLTNRTPATGYDVLVWDYPPSAPSAGGSGGGGGVTGSFFITDTYKGRMSVIEYPADISVEQGDMKFAFVKVKNTGNGTLHNVFISIAGIDAGWYSIDPSKTDIYANDTRFFIIKFNIPSTAAPEKYPASMSIDSDEGSDRVQITFEVTIPSAVRKILRISDIKISIPGPDDVGTIKIVVENMADWEEEISMNLIVPSGWMVGIKEEYEIVPSGMHIFSGMLIGEVNNTKTVPSRGYSSFEFKVIPDREGFFVLGLKVSGKRDEIVMEIPVLVEAVTSSVLQFIAGALIVAFAVLFVVYKRREKPITFSDKEYI